MSKLQPVSMEAGHFNVRDKKKFAKGIAMIKESLNCGGATLFSSDNMILWNKNYSMLREKAYAEYISDEQIDIVPKTIIWRTYVLDFLLKRSLQVDGNIIELGVLKGDTAMFLCNQNAEMLKDRIFYLIDLFEWNQGDIHTKHRSLLDKNLYTKVQDRFEKHKFIKVIQGDAEDILPRINIDKIAFAHIDMNDAVPELFSLAFLASKISRGGSIIFDDYGWWGYSEQKLELDKKLNDLNLDILELPTGQGIVLF